MTETKKIHCGKCSDCSPASKKKVQDDTWEPMTKTPGFPDRTTLRNKTGATRSCPTWALTSPAPIRLEEEEPEEDEEEKEQDDGSWIMNDGYGPKCSSCGSGQGEDHCNACPYKKWGGVPTTC